MRAATAPTSAATTITVAALGARALELGRVLAEDHSFAVAITADTYPQLLSSDEFPTRVLLVDEARERESTHARIAIAQGLGVRVVLVVSDPESLQVPWCADFVVQSDIDRERLLRVARSDAEVRRERRREAHTAPPRTGFSDREREALVLWSRTPSIASIAAQMGGTTATASTFLWRARRKLAAGAALGDSAD